MLLFFSKFSKPIFLCPPDGEFQDKSAKPDDETILSYVWDVAASSY